MRSLCLLAALACLPAAAQDAASLFPLGTGDTWTYLDLITGRYQRWTVVGDTLVGGETYRLVDRALLELSGQRVGGSREPVRVETSPDGSAGGVVNPTGGLRAGGAFLAGPGPGDSHTVVVGGLSYTVPGGYMHTDLIGTGYYTYADFASGIGLIETGYFNSHQGGPPPVADFRLRYAEVGGQVYGANPVASGDGPARVPSLALTAAPSPAADALTLRLDGAERAAVEVYSATGRLVSRGEAVGGALRLDVRTWAPGVYVARAVADGQAVTTRLVVTR